MMPVKSAGTKVRTCLF